jgi:hypothetical protein
MLFIFINQKYLRMKNLLKLSLVFLLLLNACSNEKVEETTPEAEVEESVSEELMSNLLNSARTATSTNQESSYVEEGECFVVNYPYSLSDGQTSTTLNNDDELDVYLQNITYESSIYIQVPFSVSFADGSQQTINTYEEFEVILEDCYEDYDDYDDYDDYEDECFELNYPLTALDSNSNEVIVYSEQDLYNFEFAGFLYPISVTLTDGSQVSVTSPQEFDSLYNDCYDIDDCDDCEEQCFEIVFPFSFVLGDGSIVDVNDYDELWDFVSQLTEEDTCVISYPLTVQFEDGTQQTANSDEELDAFYESCE